MVIGGGKHARQPSITDRKLCNIIKPSFAQLTLSSGE